MKASWLWKNPCSRGFNHPPTPPPGTPWCWCARSAQHLEGTTKGSYETSTKRVIEISIFLILARKDIQSLGIIDFSTVFVQMKLAFLRSSLTIIFALVLNKCQPPSIQNVGKWLIFTDIVCMFHWAVLRIVWIPDSPNQQHYNNIKVFASATSTYPTWASWHIVLSTFVKFASWVQRVGYLWCFLSLLYTGWFIIGSYQIVIIYSTIQCTCEFSRVLHTI